MLRAIWRERAPDDGTNPCTLDYSSRLQGESTEYRGNRGWHRRDGDASRLDHGSVTISCAPFANSGGSGTTYEGGATLYLITATTNFADPALGFFGLLGLTTPNLSASHSRTFDRSGLGADHGDQAIVA